MYPFLSGLGRKYKGQVTVINVLLNGAERENAELFIKSVQRLLQEEGNKADFHIAFDGFKGEPQMEKTWLRASGNKSQGGIFVVDREGKIAYMGHDGFVQKAVEGLIAGHFDPQKIALTQKRIHATDGYMWKLPAKQALDLHDKINKLSVPTSNFYLFERFQILLRLDQAEASRYAHELLTGPQKNDPALFYYLANSIPSANCRGEVPNLDWDIYLKLAQRGLKLNPLPFEQGILHAVEARCYAAKGDWAQAEKVIDLAMAAQDKPSERYLNLKKDIQERVVPQF
jgi:hypothetical protein